MSSGWIKLSYKLLEWEWYGDTNMVRLFLHLLLKANYKPVRRQGVTFGRGVVATSREELHRETGLSPRSIRTCLDRLKSTGEISITATNGGSVITISNYDKYQFSFIESDQRPTSETTSEMTSETTSETTSEESDIIPSNCERYQETILQSDQQSDQQNDQQSASKTTCGTTTSKEYNNIYLVVDADTIARTREEFFEDFFSEERRAIVEELCMARSFGSIENFKRLAADVLVEWESVHETHRTVKDARQHLINHCSKKMNAELAEQKKTRQNHETAPDTRQYSDPEETRRREFIEHIAAKLSTPDSPDPDMSRYY